MRTPAPPPSSLLHLAGRQEWLVSTRQCDRAGVGDARRAALRRAGALTTVVRGVHRLHVPAAVPPLVSDPGAVARRRRREAIWRAVLTAGEEHAVVTGWCALVLQGVEGVPPGLPPEVASTTSGTHAFRGGVRRRVLAAGRPVRWVDGVRAVDAVTALAQTLPDLDRAHAVAVLDSALHRRLVDDDELPLVVDALRGRRGAAAVAPWWDLVDGRAQSPLETWARLQCRDAGIPPHDLQVAVRDASGRVVARGDLGWVLDDGRLLVVEIDGAGPHGGLEALYRDRERQNAIVATGALVLRFTAHDVRTGRVAAAVRRHVRA